MEGLLEVARQTHAIAYVTIACAAALLYDYGLTLGDEVRCIWPSRTSIPKILFLINRYIVLPMSLFTSIGKTILSPREIISRQNCISFLKWLVAVVTVANLVMEAILLTRVIALYRTNKIVIAVSSFLFAAGNIFMIALTINDAVGDEMSVGDMGPLPGCFPNSSPRLLVGYWIAPLITESMLFFVVVWRVIAWSRNNLNVPPALYLMARDSSVYFAVIFLLLLVSLLVFKLAPPSLSTLFITPVISAGCIAGSRMLLNLRTLSNVNTDDGELELARIQYFDSHFTRSRIRFKKNSTGAGAVSSGDYPSFSTRTTDVEWQGSGPKPAGPYKGRSSF